MTELQQVSFVINVRPFGKQRHRTSRGRTYTPKETVAYEKLIAQEAALHFKKPFDGPVSVDIIALFKPAKSWSKKKTAAAWAQPHTQKPDLDNVMKAICDGMNKIAYHDDSQISYGGVEKYWGCADAVRITVTQLPTTFK